MGHDVYCVICGGPPYSENAGPGHPGSHCQVTWLDDWVGLRAPEKREQEDEGLIPIGSYDGEGSFSPTGYWPFLEAPDVRQTLDSDDSEAESSESGDRDSQQPVPTYPYPCFTCYGTWAMCQVDATRLPDFNPDDQYRSYGVAMHRACAEVLQRQLKYTPRFEDIWGLLEQQDLYTTVNHLHCTDYGGMRRFQEQHFTGWGDNMWPCYDGWMVADPRTCQHNRSRIVGVWAPLVQRFRDEAAAAAAAAVQQAATAAAAAGAGAGTAGSVPSAAVASGSSPAAAAAAPGVEGPTSQVSLSTFHTLLQLIIPRVQPPQQQLQLACTLLQVCRSVPTSLAGLLSLSIEATSSQTAAVAAWIEKHLQLLKTLDMCVTCCRHDAQHTNSVIGPALQRAAAAAAAAAASEAALAGPSDAAAGSTPAADAAALAGDRAAMHQGLRLLSFSGCVGGDWPNMICPRAEAAAALLQQLPGQHLTSLALNRTGVGFELSRRAARSIASMSQLRELTLPGAGLAARLSRRVSGQAASGQPEVLSGLATGLKQLTQLVLSDAGSVPAEDLHSLAAHLQQLQEVQLCYMAPPSGIEWTDGGLAAAAPGWPALPVRSLELRVPSRAHFSRDNWHMPEPVLQALGSLTGLTQLALREILVHATLPQLAATLGQLSQLQRLELTAVSTRRVEQQQQVQQQVQQPQQQGGEEQQPPVQAAAVPGGAAAGPAVDDGEVALIQAIAALPQLQRIRLGLTLSCTALLHLAAATKLTQLELPGPIENVQGGPVERRFGGQLTDAAVIRLAESLSGLPGLRVLSLARNARLTSAVLPHVAAAAPQLEVLDLSFSQVSDEHLSCLRSLRHLRRIALDWTHVSDAGLRQALSGLQQLQQLSSVGTDVTDATKKRIVVAAG